VRLIEKDAGLHLHLISIQDMGLKVAFTLSPSWMDLNLKPQGLLIISVLLQLEFFPKETGKLFIL